MGSQASHTNSHAPRGSDAAPGFLLADFDSKKSSIDEMVADALRSMREHLSMDIGFVSEFREGRRVFRHVSSLQEAAPIRVGDSSPLEESYCQRVVDGRLPGLIRDASLEPAARELPVTTALPVGAHLSVPISFSDGSVYGTFCCFSYAPDQSLTERDLGMMRHLATFLGRQIERESETQREGELKKDRVQSVLDAGNFVTFYQPIVALDERRVVGFEALTRFLAEPNRPPDQWFNEAAEVGLQQQLELATITKAISCLKQFPSDAYVGLNISPETILGGSLAGVLSRTPLHRVVLEVTEHAVVSDYANITEVLAPLRRQGLALAVDDAGAGFASFRHILKLEPDIIKLDRSLIQAIDTDRDRRALAAALIRFAQETDAEIIAEGVETGAELHALRDLGVRKAQGYLIGRPAPPSATLFQEHDESFGQAHDYQLLCNH
ncbi:MAG: EAL domain-containing protein [Woeseia sp.]